MTVSGSGPVRCIVASLTDDSSNDFVSGCLLLSMILVVDSDPKLKQSGGGKAGGDDSDYEIIWSSLYMLV